MQNLIARSDIHLLTIIYIIYIFYSETRFSCLEDAQPLVIFKQASYYCGDRLGARIDGTESAIQGACALSPHCTGYDYKWADMAGHLCKQTSYPGASKRSSSSHHYKLCQIIRGLFFNRRHRL